MVESWQVVVAASGILVTVLTVYGGLIKRNYDATKTLKQRLLGTSNDETDPGFLSDTTEALDGLSNKMDRHHDDIRSGLMENKRRVESIENRVERVEHKVDAVQEVVQEEHDVHFHGNAHAPTSGGQEQASENTRTQDARVGSQPQSTSNDSN